MGTKGERFHDWAYIELADLDATDFGADFGRLWTRGLLIRRDIANGDLAFFSTWCSQGTAMETLVRIEAHRWAIEGSFETAKNELGLDHNETRSWHGWHRHVSPVMLAFAMMAAIRHPGSAPPPPKQSARHVATLDPLVHAENPADRQPNGTAPDPANPYNRMIPVARSTSGRSKTGADQIENVTVVFSGG